MYRPLTRLTSLAVLAVIGGAGILIYRAQSPQARQIEELTRQVDVLEKEKHRLEEVVQRLQVERRVADMLVTRQEMSDGMLETDLLFQEYARDGSPLPARSFTIAGNVAHLDAMVIKFDRGFIEDGDALRGHSIVLFHKLYGDFQTPEDAYRIDQPGRIPEIYRGSDPQVTRFEQELWENFWKLVEEEEYRQRYGVRVAQGEGLWLQFHPDRLYTLTVESDGGLNIRSEPLRGIYREALRRG
jgi:hypothetical protein